VIPRTPPSTTTSLEAPPAQPHGSRRPVALIAVVSIVVAVTLSPFVFLLVKSNLHHRPIPVASFREPWPRNAALISSVPYIPGRNNCALATDKRATYAEPPDRSQIDLLSPPCKRASAKPPSPTVLQLLSFVHSYFSFGMNIRGAISRWGGGRSKVRSRRA
jgi:hypothetical protein